MCVHTLLLNSKNGPERSALFRYVYVTNYNIVVTKYLFSSRDFTVNSNHLNLWVLNPVSTLFISNSGQIVKSNF